MTISNFSIYFVHILKVRPFNYQKSDKQNSANERHPIISLKRTSVFSILVFVSVQFHLLIFFIRLTILLKMQSNSLFTDYSEELFMQNKTYAYDFIWHISLLHSFVYCMPRQWILAIQRIVRKLMFTKVINHILFVPRSKWSVFY